MLLCMGILREDDGSSARVVLHKDVIDISAATGSGKPAYIHMLITALVALGKNPS